MSKSKPLALSLAVMAVVMLPLLLPTPTKAIPAFARQYNTSCSTCHVDFPKLNDFGKAFKDAGFKFPKDDEAMVKIPPVMLGAPAQVELWPRSTWPGRIPGQPPIGLRMNSYFQVLGKNQNNFPTVVGSNVYFPPKTDFQTGLFSIFTAGNLGDNIAFWVDDDLSVAGSAANGGLGDGYIRFMHLNRYLHLPKDSLNLRVGQFELDLPFSQARSWNLSGWDILAQNNIGIANQQFVNNSLSMDAAARGVEISGGHHYGGYWYSFAVADQNTSNTTLSNPTPPPVTAYGSDSNFKDIYGRVMYRFNLDRDKGDRRAIQAASATGPVDHTSLSLGAFGLYGRSAQHIIGASVDSSLALLTAREPFYRVGADFNLNLRKFNLFGLYMYGRDQNLVPVAADGTAFPTDVPAIRFLPGRPATFGGGFLESDYMLYPWMMLIMRYDAVNSPADFLNGASAGGFFAPARNTRNRFTPGAQFLVRANIKASFEYQIRPQQSEKIDFAGNPVATAPFRVNSAVFGIEFVY